MKISGFTIIRNAIDYDFPVVESIKSMLDLVDELVIALGDSSDDTEVLVKSIISDKIKIIKTDWEVSKYNRDGMVYAHQTDIALKECTGDWCIYLQADEVLHEDAVPIIKSACEKYLTQKEINGFLLRYVHFYGDYDHYITSRHFAYPKEVRIVRNIPDMHSWRDAQSFRIIPDFDYENYWQKENTFKLKCILLNNAYVYHYGHSRNPENMVKKVAEQNKMHIGEEAASKRPVHNYGNISYMPTFKGKHPAVMQERISNIKNYSHLLKYEGNPPDIRKVFGLKYRILNFFESKMPNGNRIGGFKNYIQKGIYR